MKNKVLGKLYVVATPIGNLGDITNRAIETLKEVDYIFAEDTRQTQKLLQHFLIKTNIKPLHKFNEEKQKENILNILEGGESVAIVSDAGTPIIADPGASPIRFLRGFDIDIIPIPGVSSVIAALSVSGLMADGFSFAGFLPSKKNQRIEFLSQFITKNSSTVFFETPHRVLDSISDFHNIFQPKRKVFIGRELTKKFEETILLDIKDAKEWVSESENRQKGEFVIILDKYIKEENTPDWDKLSNILLEKKLKTKQVAEIVAEFYSVSKKEVYQKIIKDFNSNN